MEVELDNSLVISSLRKLYKRDLIKLKNEILSYSNEKCIWKIEKQIANSAGNLVLHLVGNLNTYIGSVLGNTGYERNRPLEFSLKDVPRAELTQMIDDTIAMIDETLSHIPDQSLNSEYPLTVFEDKMTTGYFLIHLSTHLGYHLGQVNYHRRLIDTGKQPIKIFARTFA